MIFEYALIHRRKYSTALIETFFISALNILGVFFLSNHSVPFFEEHIPWLWLAPVITGLLYGWSAVLLSAVILFLAVFFTHSTVQMTLQNEWYLACAGFFFYIAAEFGSYWKRELKKIESLNQYVNERFDYLSKAYYLLKCSNDAMEQFFIEKPISLRNSFCVIKDILRETKGKLTPSLLKKILNLLSEYGEIQEAQMNLVNNGVVSEIPLSTLGMHPEVVSQKDDLVQYALKEKKSSFYNLDQLHDIKNSKFLIVVPMIIKDNVVGLLLVKKISFQSLNEDTIRKIMIILYYFMSVHEIILDGSVSFEKYPETPFHFLAELIHVCRLKKEHSLNSSLVIIHIPNGEKTDFFLDYFATQKRQYDESWIVKREKSSYYVKLMPLDGNKSVLGYIRRVSHAFLNHFGVKLEEAGILFEVLAVKKAGVDENMCALMELISEKENKHACQLG